MTPAPGVMIVAVLSLGYLCSSDIFALINYVGFATWISIGQALIGQDTYCALIGQIMMLLRPALLCNKDTAQSTKSPLLGAFRSFCCVFMSMKILKIFIFIFFRFGCPLYPLAQMETPGVGETNQGAIF